MRLTRRQIVDLFLARGDVERAGRAQDTLPSDVDLQRDAAALRALGIDPGLLATQIDNLEA